MRIKYREPSPKAGLTEHIDNVTGRLLVTSGLAEVVPYKDFRERLAAEASPSGPAPIPEWGILEATTPLGQNAVIKRCGAETTYYGDPLPEDCPASIRERFALLAGRPTAETVQARKEAEQNRQFEQQAAEKVGLLRTIFAGK